jgi:hypothetical protein
MQYIKKAVFYSTMIFSALGHNYNYASEVTGILTSPGMEFAAKEAAKEGVRVASEVGKVVTVPLTYISLATELYSLGKATRSYLSPNEQEQAKATQVNRDIKFLNSQQAFRSCLMQNRNSSQIDNSGIPTTCENAAYMLAMFAGQDEVERLTGIINKYKR